MYDLAIGAVGYERRARSFFETRRPRASMRCAFAFQDRRELSFDENHRWFTKHGFTLYESPDSTFAEDVSQLLSLLKAKTDQPLRVILDVSSFDRYKLATLISHLWQVGEARSVVVDFVYTLARFTEPGIEPSVMRACGPVTPSFAGWTLEPERPIDLILGLGYEPERALGLVEMLEPATMWLLRPLGSDERYLKRVNDANREVLKSVLPERVLDYRVSDPLAAFRTVEGLVYSSLKNGRPLIVPLGPKIFAVACLIAALLHKPHASVWRVSSGHMTPAAERRSSGHYMGLQVSFPGQKRS